MKKTKWIATLLALGMCVSVAAFAAGCNEPSAPPDDPGTDQPGGDETEKPAPESISVTNETTPAPGAFELTVSVLPEGADTAFTSALVGEHTFISLDGNEVAISTKTPDGYEFTVEVTSVKAPSVKSQATFTVDNRPSEGLFITTAQRTVNAMQNEGKLQLEYTVYPETDVTFSIEEATEGVSVSESGLIELDEFVDNGISFTVNAVAIAERENEEPLEFRTSVTMNVLNEVEREIATEADLLAVWKGYDDVQSVRNMKNFYKLTNNIRLNSSWKAIGFKTDTQFVKFEGSFNGNGYTISNFNMNAGWNSGFFYVIGEVGVVKNLTLESGKNAGEGLKGLFSGPFAGKIEGKVENCVADVRVESVANSAGVYQPIATFAGTLETTARVINCISYGQAIVDKTTDKNPDDTRWSGFVASVLGTFDVSVRSCFMLDGTAKYAIGHHTSAAVDPEGFFKTAEEMQTSATFAEYDEETGLGFDRAVWRIKEGAMPVLKNEKFIEPASISVTFGGEALEVETLEVKHGSYAVTATVAGSEGAEGAPQAFGIKLIPAEGVSEDAFTVKDGAVFANVKFANDGDKCTLVVYSLYSPEVNKTVELTFKKELSLIASLPESVTYTAETSTFDLAELGDIEIIGGTDAAQLTFELKNKLAGVTLSAEGLLTLTAESDNTAEIKIAVKVSEGGLDAQSEELTVTIINTEFKDIATAEQFLAIWDLDKKAESMLHMHNNYRLTADIHLSAIKPIGFGIDSKTADGGVDGGYGLFGTFDGNGYTLSWDGEPNVGWNSGLFTKVESTGVIKNLKMQGQMSGVIAGPIGVLDGRVENCLFNVRVRSQHASQGIGSAVGSVRGKGKIVNSIAIGVTRATDYTDCYSVSAFYGQINNLSDGKNIGENCFVLEGSVANEYGKWATESNVTSPVSIITETEMKTAAAFSGFDSAIWNFTEGELPALIQNCSTSK